MSILGFQGLLQQYTGAVYYNNQPLLNQMISDEIQVKAHCTLNGVKQPVKEFGKKDLLLTAQTINDTLIQIIQTNTTYLPHTYKKDNEKETISLEFEQLLMVKENDNQVSMFSKGTQIWTRDTTGLIALEVFEEITTYKPGEKKGYFADLYGRISATLWKQNN